MATKVEGPLAFRPIAAPGSPANGWLYYDSTALRIEVWDGAAWQVYTSVADIAGGLLAGNFASFTVIDVATVKGWEIVVDRLSGGRANLNVYDTTGIVNNVLTFTRKASPAITDWQLHIGGGVSPLSYNVAMNGVTFNPGVQQVGAGSYKQATFSQVNFANGSGNASAQGRAGSIVARSNGAGGSWAALAADDVIGTVSSGQGSDGTLTRFAEGGFIQWVADGAWTATSHPMRLEIATTPAGSTTPVIVSKIDRNGAVLIGLTASGPNAQPLQVAGGIGLSGTTVIGQNTNADGAGSIRLNIQQISVSNTNSGAYSYAGSAFYSGFTNGDGYVIATFGRVSAGYGLLNIGTGGGGSDTYVDLSDSAGTAFHSNSLTKKTSFGVASAQATVHIAAGTAAANTAPIKVNSGVNLTTPEAGTIEYNGNWWVTDSTATRYKIAAAPVVTTITTSVTIAAARWNIVNVNAAALTPLLPASPLAGDIVEFVCMSTCTSLTLGASLSPVTNVMGKPTMVCDLFQSNGAVINFTLIYNATEGWLVVT